MRPFATITLLTAIGCGAPVVAAVPAAVPATSEPAPSASPAEVGADGTTRPNDDEAAAGDAPAPEPRIDEAALLETSLPASGTIGGCVITLGTSEHWESGMMIASPPDTNEDGLTNLGSMVRAHVACADDATARRLRVRGWIVEGERAHAALGPIVLDDRTGVAWDLSVAPSLSIDVRVHLGGPILDEGTAVRAVLAWTGDDGTSVLLGASPGRVHVAT
jgi:hypothetical protein